MPYAIVRIAKLKQSNVAGSGMHVSRTRHTPNADRSKLIDNQTLLHNEDMDLALAEVVEQKIQSTPQLRKIRTDAVHCVEMLLTASPEYFRPTNPAEYGAYESEKLVEWQQATVNWLDREYGSKIVRAELHLDEATPHIHAYLVPVDNNGQLNCKKMFGDRKKMFALQDSYAAAMKPLGMERGIKGARAEHTDVKDYYAVVNAATSNELNNLQVIQARAAAYELLKRDRDALARQLKAVAAERDKLAQQLEAQQQITKLRDELANSSATRSSLSIAQVAIELQIPPDAIAPRTNPIDLIQQTLKLRFSETVHWAGARFGASATVRLFAEQIEQVVAERAVQIFTPPSPSEAAWESARNWLAKTQHLPLALVDRLRDEGVLYASERGLVFLHRNLDGGATGAMEIDRQDDLEWQIADGSSRTNGWYYFESAAHPSAVERVVMVDHPLDAMAYATLNQSDRPTLYLAANDGGWMPSDLPPEVEIVIATARQLVNLPHGQTQLPTGGSWREDLAVQMEHIAAEIAKQHERRSDRESQESSQGCSLGGR